MALQRGQALTNELRNLGAYFADCRLDSITKTERVGTAMALDHDAIQPDQTRAIVLAGIKAPAQGIQYRHGRQGGPFAREEHDREDREAHRKALGAMARAGFGFDVCDRALRMDREAAEVRIRERDVF